MASPRSSSERTNDNHNQKTLSSELGQAQADFEDQQGKHGTDAYGHLSGKETIQW